MTTALATIAAIAFGSGCAALLIALDDLRHLPRQRAEVGHLTTYRKGWPWRV